MPTATTARRTRSRRPRIAIRSSSLRRRCSTPARSRLRRCSARSSARPTLRTRADVMAPIVRESPERVMEEARRVSHEPEADKPKTLAHGIRAALAELMRKYPEMLVFGEDVAEKGGVYGVTVGLWKT